MKILFLAAFLAVGLNSLAEALEINCKFEIDAKTLEYSCQATIVVTGDLRLIDRISGWHLPGKANGNCKGFNIRKQKGFKKFPRGLWKYFNKVEKIIVEETEIDEIAPEDLEGLPEVIDVDLSDNEITELPEDLFKHCPKLDRFKISGNPIINIGDGFFKYMENLTTLDVSKDPCKAKSAEVKSAEIVDGGIKNILKLVLKQSNPQC